MAEVCLSFPIPPDVSRSWRKISIGKLNLLYSEEKVLPNYLRASAGSCHDACKYGKIQSEEKARGSTLKRVAMKLSRDKILSQSLDSPLMRSSCTLSKKIAKASSGSRKCDSEVKSEVRRYSAITGNVEKKEASTGLNNKSCPKKMKKKTISCSESRLASPVMRKKKASQSSRTVFIPPGRASLGFRGRGITTGLNKRANLSKLKSVAEKGSGVQYCRRENNTMTRKNSGISKADPKKAVMSGRASFVKRLPDRSGLVKVTKSEAKKSGLKPKQGNEKQDLVEEKTLYVIEMETENAIVGSAENERCVIGSPHNDPRRLSRRKNLQEESESTMTDIDDESSGNQVTKRGEGEEEDLDDDGHGDDESLPDGKKVPRQRKIRAFSSEDAMKYRAMKLKFKRGRTVDLASQDNIPRRLKFKRGRGLTRDDSTPNSSSRRSFRTKGNNLRKDEHKLRSLIVALRHQEIQRKKDHSRVLFNNVIKETASKLVKTRKSKVKALVGAFETVISLQEGKPSATT
ncbi:PREDICTED: uncharacterized protein LOC104802964 [Tarenaya hassleriana]|uniref:uncharacterized protein LOC104802964 n=1 Tax=Tarenaya hassleriana TaxID=28532 RepID=UPI0008FD2AC2|nr:PREDICTED: uncharacterized protein LOC104802964 [Tarenaya hassleriana]XP_019056746.1 PREDICTED: uncharacterized protein LOC104802964 [Tarenaya hassleriana]XP_019056747.1 PREDICTED: uncharacterized protein LOC104802964 [Tarenaya hassleriana]XP_019056748.1 PREDICTED: uncharacterized protein LOC104802964 [Tarenaya hassleriana]XP_019056749.1 PREDICTED: uncharacterized protein LOC104802964 [Tarenaya hassleriana]